MAAYDVIVIGGGVLGCFVMRAMTRFKLRTALLEAREDVCTGISRANTSIVYSGTDTKPGTLKSRMCVRAAQTFGELCRTLGVRYSPCGSLMVCFGPMGENRLRQKMAQGLQNGVRGLRLLTVRRCCRWSRTSARMFLRAYMRRKPGRSSPGSWGSPRRKRRRQWR
jgi:glycerol-3-phosphate dehydrogenase